MLAFICLEVGCGDARSRIVKQFKDLTVSDADQVLINSARRLACPPSNSIVFNDFLVSSLTSESSFTSAFLLDVLEHIPREDQNRFSPILIIQ